MPSPPLLPQVTEAKLIALRAHADHIGSDHIALTELVAETRAMLGLGGSGGGMAMQKKTKARSSERCGCNICHQTAFEIIF